jgi:tetratricopeptide (TPR) repeat protein
MLVRKAVRNALGLAAVVVWFGLPSRAEQPTNRALASALDSAIAAGQTDQAQRALAEMLARPHVELDVLLETGAKLAEREYYAPAAEVFGRCAKDYPHNFEAHYNLALAEFALRRYAEAQKALDGLDAMPKSEQLARDYLRGKILDALGQTEQAERSLTAAFNGAPEQENYGLDLGLFFLRRQLYAKAVATLEATAKYHPDSIYVALGLALAQVFGDDPPRAVATCRKILAKDPDFSPARLLLVVAFYMNGENENCARETAAAISRPVAPPYLYYLHAASLLKLNSKEYAAMLKDLDAANRGIPGCAFCYFTLSKVHQELGDDAAAMADLETLVGRIDPEFAQGWYRLGNLYQRAGRRDDAERTLGKFRAIKSVQTDRETDYLRKVFLSAVAADQQAAK